MMGECWLLMVKRVSLKSNEYRKAYKACESVKIFEYFCDLFNDYFLRRARDARAKHAQSLLA